MASDERTRLALAVQNKARTVVNDVKRKGKLDSVAWVAPLIAAPAAVSTMAILLKAAGNSEVANLKVDNRQVKDGVKCVGELPCATLHGNLHHCGSVGQFAFKEARKKMDIIGQTADSMIKDDDGAVEYILDLLDDPKGARRHLKSQMTAMGVSAQRSLDEIVALTERFNDWYLIINCLMGNTFDGRGKTVEKVKNNEQKQEEAKKDLENYGRREESTQRKIADLETQCKEASDSVIKAQEEVDRLQNLPPIPEPPFHEEYIRAQNAITIDDDTSLLKKGKNKFFGESKSDKTARLEKLAKLKKDRDEYMENAKKRRDEDRQLASDRLEKARAHELELLKLIDAANKELARNQTQLDKAKDNLAKTETTLRQLGEKRLSLEETLTILEESTRQLGELKDQVQKLVVFFESILSTIKTTVDEDVDNFLRTIEEGILSQNINGTTVLESVDLSKSSKKMIINKALQIQGSYSAIRHVTNTYVSISDAYIMPAITKMEKLSLLEDEDWRTERVKFTDWCNEAIGKIQSEAEAAGHSMEPSMTERVMHLHELVMQNECQRLMPVS